ncbi:conserved membrane protein of unknown function [Tepidanaerobacter acetatoxydans Re1]|uniref:Transmembrane protein n=1 Tax=Tepidanaerobacter acetatoxydans (strain DSM 21804 / JCM 16047 / Re1) TaxID=1209989 RepID=F4LXM0_TEPAE|nr:DUF308 domain-containing protein [Tepidanaerobacter acetatoxydans]AEE91949.1 hypothetical protein TepRe1_1818 [Tepidanaerobacter acetatoxydans Re1]CCP26777.1 conserved membrane protein of unknown function [Tepidanaerobacter acetatoxydans Re1]
MSALLFKNFTKYALLRAAFWGIMGIILFALPDFFLDGMFYAIVGYMLVDGILRIVDFVRESAANHIHEKKAGSPLRYFSLVVAVLLLVVVIHSIIFRDLLIQVTPVYLGGLLLLRGILYFVIALCANTFMQRGLLVALSGIVFLGGAAVLVFTFGFGIGGIPGLIKVSGAALLLACLYELAAYLVYRKNLGNRSNEEDIQ